MPELTIRQWHRVFERACDIMSQNEATEPYEDSYGWESAWDQALRDIKQSDREAAQN